MLEPGIERAFGRLLLLINVHAFTSNAKNPMYDDALVTWRYLVFAAGGDDTDSARIIKRLISHRHGKFGRSEVLYKAEGAI